MRLSVTLVQATGDSTGGRALFCRGDKTAGQIVDVPQIQEQNVEVIKVILQEECQRLRLFLLTACGDGAVGCTQRVCAAPQPTPTREV